MRLIFLALSLILLSFFAAFSQTVKTPETLRQLLDLPAPAPVTENADAARKGNRPADFLSYKNVPPDDAPIEDLLDYWASQPGRGNTLNFQSEPTDKTVERLLDYCDENPEELTKFLSSFPAKPEIAERVKRIYDKFAQEKSSPEYEYTQVREWLKYNSSFYVNELVREAQKIKDVNDYISIETQFVLRSLAKVDWDSASPIISRLESDSTQPYSQILAKWVLYQHAIDEKDSGDTERYREDLKKIVENRKEFWKKRDLAMDALVAGGDWEGRDEWYLSLLEDETLLTIQDNGHTGLTTLISASPPEKWLDKMLELVKSDKLAVRSAAVRNLVNQFSNEKEIAVALLPWLSNPDWAKQSGYGERRKYISALGEMDLPESIPGLIAVLTNEDEFQTVAANALMKYKDIRAVPPLRAALAKAADPESRNIFITALVACGGYSDDEQMTSLEAYATLISTPEGQEKVQNPYVYEESGEARYEPLPLPITIGQIVAAQTEPAEGLVWRAIERVKVLRRTKPLVAQTLAEIMQKWQGRAIYLEMLRQIRTGEASVELIINLLAKRKDIREKVPAEISAMTVATGAARGIGACLAEVEMNFPVILGSTDKEAQTALLGCARLIRAKLSVNDAGDLLKSPDKTLALAAERYLESEDSVAARNLVLANRPNEALILGARQAFFADDKSAYNPQTLSSLFESVNGVGFWAADSAILRKNEQKLQKEMKEDANLMAIFGVLPEAETGQQIIRVYKNRIVYTYYEDAARYRERILTAKEYENFYRFLVDNNIDRLSSLGQGCEDCTAQEFVMFGKNGGRRVYVESTYDSPKSIAKLFEYFESFQKSELKLKYFLAEKIKGLEVLLADDKFPVYAVWKKDGDLRFLVEDKAKGEEIEKAITEEFRAKTEAITDGDYTAQSQIYEEMAKRRKEMEFMHFAWRNLENGKPGAFLPQPADAPFLRDETQAAESPEINPMPRGWQVRAGNAEIRVGQYYEGGLYQVAPGQNPVKIKDGRYSSPIVTPDGKWVIVAKRGDEWNDPSVVVRINLQTKKEFPVAVQPADTFEPVAFVAAHNKVLLFRAKGLYARQQLFNEADESEETLAADVPGYRVRENQKPNLSPKTPEYYLLDANTGAAQIVKGEFTPLQQLSHRPLQPTGNANEFWAAIYNSKTKTTEIGRYNEKTFTFQPLKQIPDIKLDSMDIWIDEKEAKIYFVYLGHLLTLPLGN